MESLTDDLWTMVLARLPIKSFTCFKLVCTQWKSIVESPFFRNLFMSVHQNSPSSSWSLMCSDTIPSEHVAHYQCDTWGLKRSLGSFIEPFLTDNNQKKSIYELRGKVKACSDVGLILIHANSNAEEKRSLYLANPVSRECVESFLDALPIGVETNEGRWLWGLVTRTENGLLLGYKIILFERSKWRRERLSFHIYSSETGLWSLETSDLPHPFLGYYYYYSGHLISLNSNFHWLGRNIGKEGVLSMDFYSASTGSVPCRVTYFPDLEKTTKFGRTCTPCSPTMAASDPVEDKGKVIVVYEQIPDQSLLKREEGSPRARRRRPAGSARLGSAWVLGLGGWVLGLGGGPPAQ
ncbi:hypothetical protein DY000_02011103 [Brassica cretica]|uniref:F-box domain-containing protein n=1 Tax=Brassica cretica TaxID=69181 RepID=A0ABQ7DBV3_BRACR|nr:hypothetical protein DY000_02011103 [Brassica cretica]